MNIYQEAHAMMVRQKWKVLTDNGLQEPTLAHVEARGKQLLAQATKEKSSIDCGCFRASWNGSKAVLTIVGDDMIDKYNYCTICKGASMCPIAPETKCPNQVTLRSVLMDAATEYITKVAEEKGLTINDESIIEGLVNKGGYCPCMASKVGCPCGTIPADEGTCHCGLFKV